MKRWIWGCPGEEALAAYLDGKIQDAARQRTEAHLADCAACRSLIGDIVTIQRFEATALPLGLKQRAIAITSRLRRRRRWVLVPLAAASVLALGLAVALLRPPNQEIPIVSHTTVTGVVARSEPPTMPGAKTSNIERKSTSLEPIPALVFPKDGGTVERNELSLKWKLVPRCRYYEIHLVNSEGAPVWQGESEKTSVRIPDALAVNDGTYFVWIAAYMDDGRVQKSSPVQFLVKSR
jgi:hypothetical protein